jgi:ribosomal protein L11
MVIRFNNLKIFILVNEAKPGGLIGSMLSPYLYSVNMNDFCKKFNELTKDYLAGIWLCVNIFSDVLDRSYYFLIKNLSVNLLINGIFDNYGKLYLIILKIYIKLRFIEVV